jgi:hypothetical protein
VNVTVVCVEWDNYLGRAAEYVQKMRAMVARHLATPHRFVCLTDDRRRYPADIECMEFGHRLAPECSTGCWEKLHLFKPGRFSGRVVYLDLDSVIVGPLDELVQHKGAVHLADWGWARNIIAGGQLVWDAGEHEALHAAFTPDIPVQHVNDQEWMTVVGGWDRLPPHLCRSYRYHSKGGPPAGACVIAFHGQPKPHDFTDGWVADAWN